MYNANAVIPSQQHSLKTHVFVYQHLKDFLRCYPYHSFNLSVQKSPINWGFGIKPFYLNL